MRRSLANEVFTTEVFAERVGVQPQTIRKSYCLIGHYLGVRPVKLPNRRLIWPALQIEILIAGGKE